MTSDSISSKTTISSLSSLIQMIVNQLDAVRNKIFHNVLFSDLKLHKTWKLARRFTLQFDPVDEIIASNCED